MRAILITATLTAAAAGSVWAVPTPGLVPKTWELEFDFHDPQRITLTLPGDDHPTTFWYILYTVTNNTDREVDFFPAFDVVTNRLETIECGFNISPTVYDAIRARHRKAFPFTVDPMKIYGRLLRGDDNQRTSIIAFPRLEPHVNSFTVYIAGLSGEIQRVRNLRFDRDLPESDQNRRFFFLRKTLAIRYDIPGDARTTAEVVPVRTGQEWVMR